MKAKIVKILPFPFNPLTKLKKYCKIKMRVIIMKNFYNLFQSANFSVQNAGCLEVGKEWQSMVSAFKYARIYYIRKGSAEITLNTTTLRLEEGNLYFIPPFNITSGNCDTKMEHYFIHLVPDVFTEHLFSLLAIKKNFSLPLHIADYFFTNIIFNAHKPTAYSQILTHNSIRLILSYFFEEKSETLADNNLAKFIKVFDYIDKHIDETIRIQDLANLMYMSKVYFSNLFKKSFGLSLQQYIIQKKLNRARALLADNSISIADVAEKLNFYDASAFTAFFNLLSCK